MKQTLWTRLALGAVLVFAVAASVSAQATQPQLTLRLRREFGYGGFGGEIQGNFRALISAPKDLSRAVLQMDGEPIGEVTQPPFEFTFQTGSFPPGAHTLTAVGYTQAGQELHSNGIHSKFLTSEQAGRATVSLIVPLVGGILGFTVLAGLISYLASKRTAQALTPGTPRHYGLEGGAICPGCHRPFARHVWAPNMLVGKLERCPYCGKLSIARRASPAELAAAEAAEAAEAGRDASGQPISARTSEEELRRELDDSRFQDC
jgi:hypothetical protein